MVIEVICRKCGRKAPADEFRVDHIYKLAVCRVCYTDRKKDLPKQTSEEKSIKNVFEDHYKKEQTKDVKEPFRATPVKDTGFQKNSGSQKDTGFQISNSKLFGDKTSSSNNQGSHYDRDYDDVDDAYLEKAVRKKQELLQQQRESVIKVKPVTETKVLYPCQKCNYKFKYDPVAKRPIECPFCGKKVDPNIAV